MSFWTLRVRLVCRVHVPFLQVCGVLGGEVINFITTEAPLLQHRLLLCV